MISPFTSNAGLSRGPAALPSYAFKRAKRELYNLTYRTFQGPAVTILDASPTVSQMYVFSDETPVGYYRWVVAFAVQTVLNSSLVYLDFHMVPPQARGSIAQPLVWPVQVPGTFFQGANSAGNYKYTTIFPPTVASVKISWLNWSDQFGSGTGCNLFEQAAGNHPIRGARGRPFALPEGWRLLAWQDKNTNANGIGSPFNPSMRMAYYELPNRTPPPYLARQAA